jgi:hypothetical protein
VLSERFDELLIKIKNPMLEHPVFYNCPIAVRFELGCETPVYLDNSSYDDMAANPEYVEASLQRAKTIYTALPQVPNLLRIDTYPNEDASGYGNKFDLSVFQKLISFPHEQRQVQIKDGDEQHTVLQLYWDLCDIDFSPDLLLREIIKADLGGISALASSVYFANTEEVYLYHVYDDRGADLVAERKETLCPVYQNLNQWILEYNRKEIDKLFAVY